MPGLALAAADHRGVTAGYLPVAEVGVHVAPPALV